MGYGNEIAQRYARHAHPVRARSVHVRQQDTVPLISITCSMAVIP